MSESDSAIGRSQLNRLRQLVDKGIMEETTSEHLESIEWDLGRYRNCTENAEKMYVFFPNYFRFSKFTSSM